MNDEAENRCDSTRLSGAHCDREKGHAGSHVQIIGNAVIGWANENEGARQHG